MRETDQQEKKVEEKLELVEQYHRYEGEDVILRVVKLIADVFFRTIPLAI